MSETLNEDRQEDRGKQGLERDGQGVKKEGVSEKLAKAVKHTPSHLPDDYTAVRRAAEAMENMQSLAGVLIKSGMCPLKKPEDVVLAITTGNQYGFPFMTSINNIHPINGKPAMSAHLHRALLLQHGVVFKKLLDYEPVYIFYKADEEGKPVKVTKTVKDANGNPTKVKKGIALAMGTKDEAPKEAHVKKETNRITKYYFKREIRTQSGKLEYIETTSSFSMADAQKAELLDKDNWNKYPSRMLDARAFTFGAREVASDILLGIYTISELADTYDIDYSIDENMKEVVIVEDK